MKIRKATQRDVKKIGDLWSEFMKFHEQYDSYFKISKNGQEIFQEYISGNISSRKSLVLVAIEDSRIVAYSLAKIDFKPPIFADRKIGVIHDQAVTSSMRGKGIGSYLYKKNEEWFRNMG